LRTALIVWAGIIASAFITLSPSIVGGLVEGAGYTPALAGQVAAANLAGMIAGPVLVLSSRQLGPRGWIVVAFALMTLGHMGSAATRAFTALATLQFGAGTGAGVAYAAATVIAAGTTNPSGTYGWMLAGQMAFGLLAFLGLPWILGPDGHAISRLFLLLGLLAALSLPLSARVPSGAVDAAAGSTRWRFSWPPALVCVSLFLHYVANNAVYVYVDRIGAAAGFGLREISIALGASTIAGFAGGVIASGASRRAAATTWIFVGIVAIVLATALMIDVRSYAVYLLAVCLDLAALVFTVPFYLAWLGEFDAGGRWVLIGNVAFSSGLAVGPAFGARLIAPPSFNEMLTAALGLFVMALVTAVIASRLHARKVATAAGKRGR